MIKLPISRGLFFSSILWAATGVAEAVYNLVCNTILRFRMYYMNQNILLKFWYLSWMRQQNECKKKPLLTAGFMHPCAFGFTVPEGIEKWSY